jgi:CcmD family protein
MNSLFFLAAVNVVIWVGLFFYLWRLDRRLTERERER